MSQGQRTRMLNPEPSVRGFNEMAKIDCLYGGTIRTVESSLATQPAIWIFSESGAELKEELPGMASVHLALDDAVLFATQILIVAAGHYHLHPRKKEEAP